MIALGILLAAVGGEFSEWTGEFDEYVEQFGIKKEKPKGLVNYGLIARQENRNALVSYVQDREQEAKAVDTSLEEVLKPYVKMGSMVIDYGMGKAGILTKLVGEKGKVVAIEPHLESFCSLFWQLARKPIFNTDLYCRILEENEQTLDSLFFEDVSLICIDAKGREDIFLKGAKETIATYRPALIINMLGGLAPEAMDRYVKEEFHTRMEEIEKMGYRTERIGNALYLALPL